MQNGPTKRRNSCLYFQNVFGNLSGSNVRDILEPSEHKKIDSKEFIFRSVVNRKRTNTYVLRVRRLYRIQEPEKFCKGN